MDAVDLSEIPSHSRLCGEEGLPDLKSRDTPIADKATSTAGRMEVQARIPKLIPRRYGQLKNENIQLRAEMGSILQENKSLQKKLVVLQREATKLRTARLASQMDTDIVKAALVQQGADNATLRRAKEEADQALLLLQQSLSEEHGKCEETEKMEVMQKQRAEKQKSPSCWASIWKWMRKRGEKKKNDI